jgi:hypothetical protein
MRFILFFFFRGVDIFCQRTTFSPGGSTVQFRWVISDVLQVEASLNFKSDLCLALLMILLILNSFDSTVPRTYAGDQAATSPFSWVYALRLVRFPWCYALWEVHQVYSMYTVMTFPSSNLNFFDQPTPNPGRSSIIRSYLHFHLLLAKGVSTTVQNYIYTITPHFSPAPSLRVRSSPTFK